jgi:hypothetical protein
LVAKANGNPGGCGDREAGLPKITSPHLSGYDARNAIQSLHAYRVRTRGGEVKVLGIDIGISIVSTLAVCRKESHTDNASLY